MDCTCTYNGYCEYHGRIKYVPPYWDDLRVPLTAARAGSNPPTFQQFIPSAAGYSGVYAWHFSATITEELFFAVQLPHSWKEGSTIRPHLHWSGTTAGPPPRDVRWQLEWGRAGINQFFPATASVSDMVVVAQNQNYHQIDAFTPITMTGQLISSMLICRLARYGNSVLDTYPAAAVALEIDFHYQLDTPGSRQETVK